MKNVYKYAIGLQIGMFVVILTVLIALIFNRL